MISNEEVRLAEWIIKQACQESKFCFKCPHKDNCKIGNKECSEFPGDWDIPTIPPDPTERPRIEWLRMLPDNELLKAIVYMTEYNCLHCVDRYNENCCGCAEGLVPWWQEKITLAQFRKDAELR